MKRAFLILITFLAIVPVVGAQSPFDKAKLAWTLPWDSDWVTAVQFVGNNRLVAGNNLGDILVWDIPAAATEKAPMPSRRLSGHTNTINRLVITPDQRYLLSASNDHAVRQWDMQNEPTDTAVVVLNERAIERGMAKKSAKVPPAVEAKVVVQKAERTFAGHKDWVLGLSLTRDGNTLVTGDDKGEVIVWDRSAAKEVKRFTVKGWVWALAVDPEGKALLVSERRPLIFDSGAHTGLRIWDPMKAEVKVDLSKDIKERIAAAAYSPDGKHLAVCKGGESDTGKVTLLDPATGKKIRELGPGHLNGGTDITFHPDGKHVVSAGRDTTAKIWRIEDGKHVRDLGTPRGGQFKDWIHSVAISPDGRWAALGDMAGQVQVWSLVP